MNNLKILIVEDEGLIAMNTRMLVEFLGHEVMGISPTGIKALEMLETLEPPHLALVDIKLKGDMDGIQTAISMKEKFGVPTLYVTGNTDSKTMEEALVTCPCGILQKPFDKEDLEAALAEAISRIKKGL